MNIDAMVLPPFVFVLHIHAAPTDMPNSRDQFAGRRLGHVVEEDQRAFGEECVGSTAKLDRHGAKNSGIKADRFANIRHIQPNVMEMSRLVGDRYSFRSENKQPDMQRPSRQSSRHGRASTGCCAFCTGMPMSNQPIIISSHVCGPQRTALLGSGLARFSAELSK